MCEACKMAGGGAFERPRLRRECLPEDPAVASHDGGAGVVAASLDAQNDEVLGRCGKVDRLARSDDDSPRPRRVCEAAADKARTCREVERRRTHCSSLCGLFARPSTRLVRCV